MTSEVADFACVACRRLKRKCSKALPSCSLCTRVGRPCDYQDPALSNSGNESPARSCRVHLKTPTADNRRHRPGLDRESSTSARVDSPGSDAIDSSSTRPGRWFLDSVATRGSDMSLNRYLLWKNVVSHPPPMTMLEARATLDYYAVTSHRWFPIVSLKRVGRELDSCSEIAAADLTALLYAMQLLSGEPSETSHAYHRAVKTALTECEQNNVLSTDYCAAYVLLATYEFGQAMFPMAYLSISHCARIFYCLGTHDKKKATQLFGVLDTWIETEERRRLWWATMILDRVAHAGFRFRPLSTSHIPPDEIIPASDDEWDHGELTVNALLVMSIEANTAVAPFARTCQAAHLLGRVCQHVNEHPNAADVDLHLEEAVHICRAVTAFKAVLDHDYASSQMPHRLFTARAVCLSALHLMYDTHGCIEVDHVESAGGNRGRRLELQQLAIDGSRAASIECVELANEVEKHTALNLPACISPLILNCLYSAGATWAWFHRETGSDVSLQNLNTIRRALSRFQSQWHASIDYLSLLDKTEYTYTGACFQ